MIKKSRKLLVGVLVTSLLAALFASAVFAEESDCDNSAEEVIAYEDIATDGEIVEEIDNTCESDGCDETSLDYEVQDYSSEPFASYPYITQRGQVVDSITYRGTTTNAVFTYQSDSGRATSWTYGCFVLPYNFYKNVYGITINGLDSTTSVPKASKGSFSETRSPRVGDIVRFNNNVHWAVVKSISGNSVTIIQMNAYYYNNCAWVGQVLNKNDTSYSFFTYSGYLPDYTNMGQEMTSGYDRVLPDGDYIIACTCDLQYYLDIVGGSVPAANGTNVELTGKVARYSTSFPACDVWTITYNNGFYSIKQKNSNATLEVANGSKEEGANVQVYQSNGSSAQQWAISRNGTNGYRIQSKCSGFSLDFPRASGDSNVRQWSNNTLDGQRWTFIQYMCSSAVTDVEATFNDVKYGDWFAGNVAFAYSRGIMTGMGGTKNFAPYEPLQREQLAVILYRLGNSPTVQYSGKFPDVPNGTWYTSPIIWAYQSGIITGYQNGYFGVGDNITREQFATMLYRYAVYKGLNTSNKASISKFNDSGSVSSWAYEAMQWAVGNGIITGKDGGTRIDPQGNAARCECAAMIQRFMVRFAL